MVTTGQNLPQPVAGPPAEWPTLRTVIEARLPAGFPDHLPLRRRVVTFGGGPRGNSDAAWAWNDQLRRALDRVRGEWAAGAIHFAGRATSELAPLRVIDLPHDARLRARLDRTRGTVVLSRGRVGPGGEWVPLVWFDVRAMTAPPAEAIAADSLPADTVAGATDVLPASPPAGTNSTVDEPFGVRAAMTAILKEYRRRQQAGELRGGIGEQAAALWAWMHETRPDARLPTTGSIENAMRRDNEPPVT